MKNLVTLIGCVVALSVTALGHPPTGIVVDKLGDVYFTDLETVWKLDTKGALQVLRAGVSGRHVHELTIDKSGNVYGADVSYEAQKLVTAVWKITPDGQLSYLLAPTTNAPRGMGIWIDDGGAMYSVEQDNRSKKETLILRRTADGVVTTLAGGSYGQADGRGTSARFTSIGGMTFGPDGALYLTDGKSLRRVTMAGDVSTLVNDVTSRTAEDGPLLFGKNDGIVTGLSVDKVGNVYICDAGNQRLLKVDVNHKVQVVYRGDGEYYPNGVFATDAGDLYVLEVGFRPPGTWLKPRVKRIAAGQKRDVVAVADNESTQVRSQDVVDSTRPFKRAFAIAVIALFILALVVVGWHRGSRRRNAGESAR